MYMIEISEKVDKPNTYNRFNILFFIGNEILNQFSVFCLSYLPNPSTRAGGVNFLSGV